MNPEQCEALKQEAWRAFERDLPQLYAERPNQWVAYRGAKQLGFAKDRPELYQRLFQQGLQREEFVIFCIEPYETELYLGPALLD